MLWKNGSYMLFQKQINKYIFGERDKAPYYWSKMDVVQ